MTTKPLITLIVNPLQRFARFYNVFFSSQVVCLLGLFFSTAVSHGLNLKLYFLRTWWGITSLAESTHPSHGENFRKNYPLHPIRIHILSFCVCVAVGIVCSVWFNQQDFQNQPIDLFWIRLCDTNPRRQSYRKHLCTLDTNTQNYNFHSVYRRFWSRCRLDRHNCFCFLRLFIMHCPRLRQAWHGCPVHVHV